MNKKRDFSNPDNTRANNSSKTRKRKANERRKKSFDTDWFIFTSDP